MTDFPIERVRDDFPALKQQVNGYPLTYLDSAATAHVPQAVLDAITAFHSRDRSNIHRGVHTLAQRATEQYEAARERIAGWIGAASHEEIVFTRGTTEAINLVAYGLGFGLVQSGDEIIVSQLEHHSNIVPWQMLAERVGATVTMWPMQEDGSLLVSDLEALLTERTKVVAVAHVSNALGTVQPIAEIVKCAHARGVWVVVDGAQAVPHKKIDVQALGCDFYAFSGHKMYGPTGIGVLYGRRDHLDSLPPYQGGGDMIKSVRFGKTVYNDVPYKFEAGTPNIAGVIGLRAAIDYLDAIGMEHIEKYETHLAAYLQRRLQAEEDIRIYGTVAPKTGVCSFALQGIHPHDIGTICDEYGVAIRTGHHCAQPVMAFYGVPATARASVAFYNTTHEVDRLVDVLDKVRGVFRR